MPLYDIRCDRSGQVFERFIKLADFALPIKCACGAAARRAIATPMFSVDNTDYRCPITDKSIRSKRDHEENLKLHGCRVLETGETAQAGLKRKAEEAELDRKIEETVEKEIISWSSDKREQLAKELSHGVDAIVERK